VIAVAVVIAGIVVAITSVRGRDTIASWTVGERTAAVTLALGLLLAVDVFLSHHSYEWFIGTHFWHRALSYGVWAFGALTIGIGVLPALFALAWMLACPISTREERALLGLLVGSVTAFGLYAAVKASYLSTIFAIRVEERNLIYLSPVVFVAAARFLVGRRARLLPVTVASAAIGWALWATPYHAYEHLYSDAFGLSILQWLNQTWYWTVSDLRWLLYGILAAGAAVALALRLADRARSAFSVTGVVLGLATIGWGLTGEISAANQAVSPAKSELARIPTPPDWIDKETGGARTMFIGKALSNSEALWTLEFWNQSIREVWSVDASVPPPGPGTTPDFEGTDGTFRPQLPLDWVVAPPELVIVGKVIEKAGGLDLYRVPHPIRMQSLVSGITADGWMQDASRFVRFATRPTDGMVSISISRGAACGATIPPARFTFRVSTLGINDARQPVARTTERIVRARVAPCATRVLHVPARAPFRIDATATGLFKSGDGRELSAFVAYSFKPS
jgi:hypothetical protein